MQTTTKKRKNNLATSAIIDNVGENQPSSASMREITRCNRTYGVGHTYACTLTSVASALQGSHTFKSRKDRFFTAVKQRGLLGCASELVFKFTREASYALPTSCFIVEESSRDFRYVLTSSLFCNETSGPLNVLEILAFSEIVYSKPSESVITWDDVRRKMCELNLEIPVKDSMFITEEDILSWRTTPEAHQDVVSRHSNAEYLKDMMPAVVGRVVINRLK